jgi:hypothetical protein
MQVSYAACGAESCGWRMCENGGWICPEDPGTDSVAPAGCAQAIASSTCGTCADNPEGCGQGECEPGPAISDDASACAANVCVDDPTCCTDEWTESCVTLAQNTPGACRGVCYDPSIPATCSHAECEAGSTLDPSCSPCAEAVCAIDGFCCTKEWDFWCAKAAERNPFCWCQVE